MRETADLWHVRLPDGRLLRATADVVRQQVLAGRLPQDIEVRRSSKEDWQPLRAVGEFRTLPNGHAANGQNAGTVASRLDSGPLRYVGLRGLLEELLAALDSLLAPRKLVATAALGLPAAVLGLLASSARQLPIPPHPAYPWLFGGAAVAVLLALTALVSRMSFIELAHLRPARVREGLRGLPGPWLALLLSLGVAIGLYAAAQAGLSSLVEWAGPALGERFTVAISLVACVVGVVLAVPLFLLLPLAAVLAVEECSLAAGLGLWWQTVRRQGWRMLVGQWIALALAVVLLLPAQLLLVRAVPSEIAHQAVVGVGLLLTPFAVAYVAVANVFLYLHFRYGGGK